MVFACHTTHTETALDVCAELDVPFLKGTFSGTLGTAMPVRRAYLCWWDNESCFDRVKKKKEIFPEKKPNETCQ
jgi:hypothetical protein